MSHRPLSSSARAAWPPRAIQQVIPALIHGLAGRVEGADRSYSEFGATLRQLYQQDTPIIALCAPVS
jgi:cobalt-precorrin 5A hydrolase/precorrin-3B C17-methyltransferase